MTPVRYIAALAAFGVGLCLVQACKHTPATDDATPTPSGYEPGEEWSGGTGTVFDVSVNAFSFPSRTITSAHNTAFAAGNSLFRQNWVEAPASSEARDGLGPLFNARSCGGCHAQDGRAAPPTTLGAPLGGLLFRLSVGQGAGGAPIGHPAYGDQLQPQGITAVPGEGTVWVHYRDSLAGFLAGGAQVALAVPDYAFAQLGYGVLGPETQVSPRIAPQMCGMGLLEAIPAADILSREDPADQDADGISGRANWVPHAQSGLLMLGRFGWKANAPTVQHQVAAAFVGDMGITSSLFPQQNCTPAQPACANSPNGGQPEISDEHLGFVTLYSQLLAVPGRRNWLEPQVLRGKALFTQVGCAACHTPRWVTGNVPGLPELSHQTIWPYTDLLLHDMGPALADHRADYLATGTEWRTPPLWGLGLVPTVNGHTRLLHDGRARNAEEAILWHGGEAQAAANAYRQLAPPDRDALLQFLNSL